MRQSLPIALPKLTFGLVARVTLLTLVFFAETVLLEFFVDSARARSSAGVGAFVRFAQHWGFRFLVTFGAAVLVFACVHNVHGLNRVDRNTAFVKVIKTLPIGGAEMFDGIICVSGIS